MKKLSRVVSVFLLPLFLLVGGILLGGHAALAADTDGDSIANSITISAGSDHTCALDAVGVHCWGSNWNGQITVPVLVHPVMVSAGGYGHTCALDDTGVHCWGDNYYGQTAVPALTDPVAVGIGEAHSCAIDNTGAHCWGYNSNGETTVPLLTNPTVVTAARFHTCALDAAGVHCWGRNNYGQTVVPALVNPVGVWTGGDHTCALDDNGVHCWGWNYYGPTTVPATLVNPIAVSAGSYNTCALDATGVHCWGDNSYTQTTVPTLVNPVAVSAGYHTCVLDATGVQCWGWNVYGQTTVPTLTPFVADNCPLVANADQLDTDEDGQGDACDTDDDNDTVLDGDDAFPLDDTESEDEDGDNLGDNGDPDSSNANTLNNFDGLFAGDKIGAAVAYAGDFDADGYGDYVIGIPGYDASSKMKDVGGAIVISGRNGNDLTFISGAVAKNAMGSVVAGGGDIDNDGFDDVVIGTPKADDLRNPTQKIVDAGSVTILFGPNGSRTETLYGTQAKALFGSAITLGDVSSDGKADIIVGSPKADDLRDSAHKLVDAGSVTILSGEDFDELNTFYGTVAKAYAGTAVATGDVDHDGSADIIIGAPNDDDLRDLAHKLIDAGSVTAYNIAGDELLKQYGVVAKAFLGKSVAIGDVNNDDYGDVLAGAPGDDNGALKDTGSVTVFFGANGSELTKIYSAIAKAGLGNSVAAGDVDDDGNADIIAGAKLDDKPGAKIIKDTGSVSVFDGGSYTLIATLYGSVSKDAFGTSVATGDVNGDDKADLIIGIPGFDIPPVLPAKTIKDAGAVKVLSGATLNL